jgi:hypothetical protein
MGTTERLKQYCFNLNKTIEHPENNDLESILNELVVITDYDKRNIVKTLKMILGYSGEPGINIFDVRKLLTEIIENL